ncbi:hypothetical protein ACFSUK_24265 [Sphingobium scionense]
MAVFVPSIRKCAVCRLPFFASDIDQGEQIVDLYMQTFGRNDRGQYPPGRFSARLFGVANAQGVAREFGGAQKSAHPFPVPGRRAGKERVAGQMLDHAPRHDVVRDTIRFQHFL